jgi:hypothetical protein
MPMTSKDYEAAIGRNIRVREKRRDFWDHTTVQNDIGVLLDVTRHDNTPGGGYIAIKWPCVKSPYNIPTYTIEEANLNFEVCENGIELMMKVL